MKNVLTLRVGALAAMLVLVVAGAAGAHNDSGKRSSGQAKLAEQLADARVATAEYALDLEAAKADGYSLQITPNMPNMGFHFLNPSVTGFDVTKPPILVYVKRGDQWQLGALEWVFTERPRTPPLKGAKYGSFPAACHYADGTFVPQTVESACAATAPGSGAAFTFWHPRLITLHVWLWYPNPDGLYASTNPFVAPFTSD
jgi:hypothetical protein